MKSVFTACLFVFSGVLAAAGQESEFSELIVFGDSLSDTGNLAFHVPNNAAPSPPYAEGRFSNGPIWVEPLADFLGVPRPEPSGRGGTNYAWAAATTRDELQVFGRTYVPGLDAQVTQYLAADSPRQGQLFSVWVGTNDLYWRHIEKNPELSANWVAEGLDRLLNAGVQDLVIFNLSFPSGHGGDDTGDLLPTFNSTLAEQLTALHAKHPSATIYEFDYASFLDSIVDDPASFGLTEAVLPACADCETGQEGTDIAENPGEFYFWDDIHVSAKGHQLIADEVYGRFFASPGDFNADRLRTVEDVDLLLQEMRKPTPRTWFDLNGDEKVDLGDRGTWVELRETFVGDANLDGRVDAADLNALALHWREEVASWEQGDFNGDGLANAADLNDLALNWRRVDLEAAAVPESGTWRPLGIGLLWLMRRRRVRASVKKRWGARESCFATVRPDVGAPDDYALPAAADSITEIVTFTDEALNHLQALLNNPSLNNLSIDQSLFDRYSVELGEFAALPGNTVNVVPEASAG